MPTKSRYAPRVRSGSRTDARRPFAGREAIDCSPPKRLR